MSGTSTGWRTRSPDGSVLTWCLEVEPEVPKPELPVVGLPTLELPTPELPFPVLKLLMPELRLL